MKITINDVAVEISQEKIDAALDDLIDAVTSS
jgi:hypothetical protein